MAGPDVLLIGPYPAWDMVELEPRYTVHKLYEAADRAQTLAEVGPHIRAIATRGELGASAELMARLPKLEIVSCYGVGTDAIDLAYARSRGIAVTNTPDVLTEDVADLGVGLLLAVALIITAELLARYVAKPSQVTRSQPRQDPAPSGVGLTRAELVS